MSRFWNALVNTPRWIDAPWAVLSVVAVVVMYANHDDVPWSLSNGLHAASWMVLSARWLVTCARIRRGTSALCPLIDRIGYLVERGDKP